MSSRSRPRVSARAKHEAKATLTAPTSESTRQSERAIDPRVASRRREVGRAAGRRRLSVVFTLLLMVTVAALGWMALHSSLFSVKHVRISGNVITSEQAILAASRLASDPPIIDVNATRIDHAIEQLPWIATATLSRSWPNSVTITVTERNPVATFALGPHLYAVLDKTGRVLEMRSSKARTLVPLTIPLVRVAPGGVLDASGVALASVAAAVPESILSSIATIEESTSGVQIVLVSGAICELGQPTELAQKMTALTTLLETSSVKLTLHSSVDLRVPDAPVVTDG